MKPNKAYKDAPWLSSFNDIKTASGESLIRSLCTSDGKGSAFKEAVLQEVILRTIEENLAISVTY